MLLCGREHVSLGVHELFFCVDHEKLVLGHALDRGALDDESDQWSLEVQHHGYVSSGPQTSHGSEAAHVYHGKAMLLFSCACVSLADLEGDRLYLQSVSSAFHVLAYVVCVLGVSYFPGFRPHSQRSSLQRVVLTVSAFSGRILSPFHLVHEGRGAGSRGVEHRGLPRRIQSRSLTGYRSLTHQADGTLQALCVGRYDERQDGSSGEFQGVSGARVLDGLSDGEPSDEVSYDGVVGASGSFGSSVH